MSRDSPESSRPGGPPAEDFLARPGGLRNHFFEKGAKEMRNISFSLTTSQVRTSFETRVVIKDVTRRLGWWNVQPGELLMGCEKCMGRRPGEPLVRLGVVRVLTAAPEQLGTLLLEPYGTTEARREGFCHWTQFPFKNPEEQRRVRGKNLGAAFVEFFMAHAKRVTPETEVNRISFEYLWDHPETRRIYGR